MPNAIVLIFAVIVMVGALAAGAQPDPLRTLVEWGFGSPADVSDWAPNGAVKDLAVKDGCLVGRTEGHDPCIVGPLFEIEASPCQYVEIRMRTSASGHGELFWTNTTDDPYGGFRPSLYRRISFTGGDFRTYRIFPFWQELGKVIHLRLDPPEDADFAVDYVKIVEITGSPATNALFDFTNPDDVWMSADDPQPRASSDGVALLGPGEKMLVSPKLDLGAESLPWLTVMMKTSSADCAVLQWASDGLPGFGSYTIPLKSDGRWHVYNIPGDEVPDWLGRIQMLALRMPLADGGRAEIKFAGADIHPRGPAELEVRRFGFEEAVNRAGAVKPCVLKVLVANIGGETASGIRAALRLASGVQCSSGLVQTVAELKPGETELLTWDVRAVKPGTADARLDLTCGSLTETVTASLRFEPPVSVQPADYVPEPKPVRGEFEVGMYYFPGWHTYARWSVLDGFPERHPILGYYQEGDPEVADWHIKWMVEHGITFMVYDWYWSAGGRHLEHGLHDGYFNAKYRSKIKFCLLWANHNPPGTSSAEDMVNVTEYWLNNYFLLPEYFKIDGKPVMVIFSPRRLTDDLGVEGVRKAFDKSREMAKARGLPGIYFVGCTYPSKEVARTLEQEGYDALSGYNYPSAGDNGRTRAPYDDMVTGYQEFWNAIADSTSLRYIPVTEPGWDSRPWHGVNARVRTGKTPAKFKTMLQNAKQFVEERNPDADPKVVLIEAWNEFGEGDYTEPHREFGFGHVDAIREVFTSAPPEHDDIVPQDVGLGPYEIPTPEPVTAWEFDDPDSPGWDASQNLSDAKVESGCLTAVSAGHDPAFYSGLVALDTKEFKAVEVRMKVDKGAGGQLFWAGRAYSFNEAASMRFDLIADGEFHVYRLSLADSPAWKARVNRLRLDPTDAARARIELDYIRFVEADTPGAS